VQRQYKTRLLQAKQFLVAAVEVSLLVTSVQGQRARRDRLDHWGARQAKLAARVCVQHRVDADDDSNPGAFWVFAESKIVFPV